MTAESIIEKLAKLNKLHISLHNLANQKTEAIKLNDIDALEKLMNDEQKHVKAINQVEKERQKEVELFFSGRGVTHSSNLLDVISLANEDEKKRLIENREQLLQITSDLKNQNNLNQQLIYQSLQYVNLSLDMLRPPNINYNYDKPVQAKAGHTPSNKSMFDSKA